MSFTSIRWQLKESSAKGIYKRNFSVAPIIPGLNESEIPAILEAARGAGAQLATYSLVTLNMDHVWRCLPSC